MYPESSYFLPPSQRADYGAVLEQGGGQIAVFEYRQGAILIIDFPTLSEQGRMFNRVGALVERMGAPRSRVLDNEELAYFIRSVGKNAATFAYGNDFLVHELVVFFNLADMGGVNLNEEEIALRKLLLKERWMIERNGFFQALKPLAVVLSIPRESSGLDGDPPVSRLARMTILRHEISHAEFYTNPLYANYCRQFWKSVMTEAQRAAFRSFLAQGSYNRNDEEMMINEMQAYLLYTPDTRAFSAQLVGLKEKEIESLRARFFSGFPEAPLAELRQ